MYLIYIISFILGLIIGSFLNVVIFRLKVQKDTGKTSINLKGRSKCPHCGKKLDFFELIPIFSYLFLKGKCSSCKKHISYQYPLVEFVSGLVTFLTIYYFGIFNLNGYFLLIISYILIVIFFYDLRRMIIPDVLVAIFFVLAIILDIIMLTRGEIQILDLFWGMLIGGGFFLVIVLISKEKWMGWGDVKLGFALGVFMLFPKIIVAYVLAFVIGAIISLILLGLKEKELSDAVPFAPFLIVGAFLALYWGQNIIEWYLRGF